MIRSPSGRDILRRDEALTASARAGQRTRLCVSTTAGLTAYYGVLTADQFRTANLTADAKRGVLCCRVRGTSIPCWRRCANASSHASSARSGRSLTSACGVGRLVVPLATRSAAVVGVDISPSMLVGSAGRTSSNGASPMSKLLQSDDTLSRVTGTFDFVHSLITFQHIPPKRGARIFERLVEALRPARHSCLARHLWVHHSGSASSGGY